MSTYAPAKLNKVQICSWLQDGINMELKTLELQKLLKMTKNKASTLQKEIRDLESWNRNSPISDEEIRRSVRSERSSTFGDLMTTFFSMCAVCLMGLLPAAAVWFVFMCAVTSFKKSWDPVLVTWIYWGLYFGFFILTFLWIAFSESGRAKGKKKQMLKKQQDVRVRIRQNESAISSMQRELSSTNQFIGQVEAELRKMNGILNGFYKTSVITPHYRDLMSMAALQYYLESGQAYKLEGPGGAYRMYEQDKLQHRILAGIDLVNTKLDRIISSLDDIILGQQQIIRAVEHAEYRAYQTSRQISQRIDQQNYISNLNQQELRYQSRLQEWSMLMNSVR